jgi:hypothetical protein
VTDIRAKRIATLTAAAQAKSQSKTNDAEQAIRRLIKKGELITFQAVQREARVSHAFLYTHPELRTRIEQLRARNQPTPLTPTPAQTPENTLVLTLTNQINQLKKRHRDEVQDLRAALEQAHGENLDLRRELARRGWIAPAMSSTP